jgi:Tol biopolymer transport system component
MASDGGEVHRLTPAGESDEIIPSWSRDGKWIYYGSNRTGPYEIWKAPAQGGKGTQVTHKGGFVAFDSRNDRSLYYTKNEDSGVWVLRGGEERLLVESISDRSFDVMEEASTTWQQV